MFEDFDRSPADVVAVINSLAETGEISTNNGTKKRPSPGFQMLFTQTAKECALTKAANIQCDSYSTSSMSSIASSLYPSLKDYLKNMLDHISAEQDLGQSSFRKRIVSIRDLLAWCARCQSSLGGKPTSDPEIMREVLFTEALRVFCDHMADPAAKEAAAEAIGRNFQYSRESVLEHVNEWAPLVRSEDSVLAVGRNRILIAASPAGKGTETYCATRQGANLLDFLATSVSVGQNTLLVSD